MDYAYHGSITSDLKQIEKRLSTHGQSWIYASSSKAVAAAFIRNSDKSKACYGSFFDFHIDGRGTKEAPIVLIERRKGVFDRIYDLSGSIYTLDNKNFERGKTKDMVVCVFSR